MSLETIRPEIELRGSTLMASVLIESWIMNVVFFSNDDQYQHGSKESEYIRLKNAMFGVKIKRITEILSKYHPDLFETHTDLFDRINEFKILRNRIAHCMITWDEKKPEVFRVWDIDEDSNKIEHSISIPYNNTEVRKYIAKVISTIPYELVELFEVVRHRLSVSHPERYAELKEAYDTSKR